MNNASNWHTDIIVRASKLLAEMARPENAVNAGRCLGVIKIACDDLGRNGATWEVRNAEIHPKNALVNLVFFALGLLVGFVLF